MPFKSLVKRREWSKKWYIKNADKMRKIGREKSAHYRKTNPTKYYSTLYKRVKKWRDKNPLRIKAQRKVFIEVRAGRMKKKSCFCGKRKTEAHHVDYSKPLEVIWLCKLHHREADRLRIE